MFWQSQPNIDFYLLPGFQSQIPDYLPDLLTDPITSFPPVSKAASVNQLIPTPHKPINQAQITPSMATTSFLLSSPPFSGTSRRFTSSLTRPIHHHSTCLHRLITPSLRRSRSIVTCAAAASSPIHALIFDCDGVILESEHLHRQAYNDAFAHFGVRCPPFSSEPLSWDPDFYDELQNLIGGGKPKMRW